MSLLSVGKNLLKNNPALLVLITRMYRLFGFNRRKCKGKQNKIKMNKSFLHKTKFEIVGSNNRVILGDLCQIRNCFINIYGNNNRIVIGDHAYINDTELHIEDDNNEIHIGKNTTLFGKTHIACIEGRKITIGEDCMFSSDVVFRTGDSHSIVNVEGNRINPSKDIMIGDHVWFGNKTIIIKGVQIAQNSIVGTGSLVTKQFTEDGVVIAGNPAEIIKKNVNWLRERI